MGFNPLKALGKVVKYAAPVAGFALGGPLGGAIGGAVSQGIAGAEKGSSADKKRKQALDIRMREWEAGAPLRSRARSMAMQGPPQRRDLGTLFNDTTNPYARRPMGPVAPPPPPGPTLPPPPMDRGLPEFDPQRPMGRPVFRGGYR